MSKAGDGIHVHDSMGNHPNWCSQSIVIRTIGMKNSGAIAALLLASIAVPAFWLAPASVFAQSADPDDDDGDNDPPDDDDDVPDPDDPGSEPPEAGGDPAEGGGGSDPGDSDGGGSDPVDPESGGSDPGDDDGAGDPGGAGAAGDGDDDAPGGGDDGDGPTPGSSGAGDDDDGDDGDDAPGGTPGSSSDDDDDSPVSGSAANGSNDDDDDDSAPSGTATGGNDDDDDRDGDDTPGAGVTPGDDDDDDIGSGGTPERGDDPAGDVETIGAGDEDENERIRLDDRDGIETDRDGFRYRRNEFVALDLDTDDVARLRGQGYQIIRSEKLGALSGTIFLLKSPARVRDNEALEQIEAVADPATLGLNHLFDSSSARIARSSGKPVSRPACGCQIGLIDTGVAAQLPMFRHATIEQRAFNAPSVTPKLHGTAIAHLFSGTAPRTNRKTRVVVADIFSGPRKEAGSTYALVKALDWMAAKGVPVINVSLAGPRNPVVAATIERLAKRGHLIVAAAGNDGPAAPPVFPGAYAGVVAVTAVDASRQVYRYANRGNYIDFSAIGVNVPSIDPRGTLTTATGTSFAAPVVAARLAERMAKPDPAIARTLIADLEKKARDLGPPGRDGIFGHGLIDGGGQ
jgi:Subtilase family